MTWGTALGILFQAATRPDISEAGGLTTEQMITGAAILFSFVGSIIGFLFSSWNSKRETKANTETTLKVASENASVAGRAAATQEFAVLTQGFQATLTRQDRRIDGLVAHIGLQDEDIDALVEHVEKLEELIPNPPGAPERPKLNRRHHDISVDL